jgi:hypothetical protein
MPYRVVPTTGGRLAGITGYRVWPRYRLDPTGVPVASRAVLPPEEEVAPPVEMGLVFARYPHRGLVMR